MSQVFNRALWFSLDENLKGNLRTQKVRGFFPQFFLASCDIFSFIVTWVSTNHKNYQKLVGNKMKKNQVRYALNSFSLTLVNFTTKFLGICDTLSYILLSLNYTWVDKRGIYHSLEKPFEILGRFGIRGHPIWVIFRSIQPHDCWGSIWHTFYSLVLL